MKLTNREKKLLIILGICIGAAILYYAVVKPQLNMVSKLEQQAKDYGITINRIKRNVDPQNPVYKEYDELYQQTQTLLEPFYPSIIQEKLILTLEEKIQGAGIHVNSITFMESELAVLKREKEEQPKQTDELQELTEQLKEKTQAAGTQLAKEEVQKKDDLMLERMSVTINFEGSFNQMYSFIKAIEQENRSIVCSNLNVESSESGLLLGVITLDFYAVPKPFVQDDEYLDWDIKGSYGKAATDTIQREPAGSNP